MHLNIHTDILSRLKGFINTCAIPNIIFHGCSGCGKITVLNEFIRLIYNNSRDVIHDYVMYVNCAQGKGIRFIREDLKHFAKTHINTHGGKFFKSIILLNADKLTIDAQSALRRCIEVFSHTTRFFIVVEDKYKLLKPIISRFCEIYIPDPVINSVPVNMYKYTIENSPGNKERVKTKTIAVKRLLNKLQGNISVMSIHECANVLYNRGYNAMDVVAYFKETNVFDIDVHMKYSILFQFDQVRKEYRSEKTAMLFIINSFLLGSNVEL